MDTPEKLAEEIINDGSSNCGFTGHHNSEMCVRCLEIDIAAAIVETQGNILSLCLTILKDTYGSTVANNVEGKLRAKIRAINKYV